MKQLTKSLALSALLVLGCSSIYAVSAAGSRESQSPDNLALTGCLVNDEGTDAANTTECNASGGNWVTIKSTTTSFSVICDGSYCSALLSSLLDN